MAQTFGPTALATPANALSIGRLVAGPVLLALVAVSGPSTWPLVAIWVVLAGSDGIDGYVARRQGATRSGAFLDPLADKFLVLGALMGLAAVHEISWVPVAVIALREAGMSAFRVVASRRGVSIPARNTAKLKTAVQDAAILVAFLPPVGPHHAVIVVWVLWAAVSLTVWTGAEYLVDGRRLLAGGLRPTPRAPSTPGA
jgi:CDP-diacylglycerol--glycerol-3-phosphate 3-phosphatidyltransferase